MGDWTLLYIRTLSTGDMNILDVVVSHFCRSSFVVNEFVTSARNENNLLEYASIRWKTNNPMYDKKEWIPSDDMKCWIQTNV